MPRQYEAMRDKFHKGGMPMKKAKAKAARIYNSKHKKNPVTKDYDSKKFKKYVKSRSKSYYSK